MSAAVGNSLSLGAVQVKRLPWTAKLPPMLTCIGVTCRAPQHLAARGERASTRPACTGIASEINRATPTRQATCRFVPIPISPITSSVCWTGRFDQASDILHSITGSDRADHDFIHHAIPAAQFLLDVLRTCPHDGCSHGIHAHALEMGGIRRDTFIVPGFRLE